MDFSSLRLIFLIVLALFVLSATLIHLRGKVRLRFDRQLVDHSALFAPYNLLMYAFSAVPARPFLERSAFPQLDPLKQHWRQIREEALRLFDEGYIRAAEKHDDVGFDSFFKQGWKRFYLKWYGEALPSAERLCPATVALLHSIPQVKAAMFALLPPDSELRPHRDPFAGSLRYHLGLITPSQPGCRILVDGQSYTWHDGEDIVFDETYVHWAENRTEQTRVILFADIERPLRGAPMRAFNHAVSAFMGRLTVSPNTHGDQRRTGLINQLYAASQRQRERKKAFKRKYPVFARGFKYMLIACALWLILLAPWPF